MKLENILDSKIYIKDNSAISFKSPEEYIQPFLDVVAPLNPTYRVDVSGRSANKNTEDENVNESFARVLVEAKLPDQYNIEEHDSVIGMVYALDTQRPSMRVYTGRNAWACTNLCIFNAGHVHSVDLMQGTSQIFERAQVYASHIEDAIREFKERYDRMNEKVYSGDQIDYIVGHLLRNGLKDKYVGTTPILAAVKELEDNKSVYSIKDGKTSQWNIYSAITQYITDKVDIVDKATKTYRISEMLN